MADFTSALYLGLRHGSADLAAWRDLTLGRPAALEEPPGAPALAARLAALQGCAAACLMPSTLHLFWDLFGMLADEPLALLIDAGAYPIARWGARQAALRGLPLWVFPHDAADVARRLARHALRAGRRPLILADGFSPGSDRAPPLAAYARIAADCGGYLVLDDTQVLGLRGVDGGGSARLPGVGGPRMLIGASLAKAFGAPLAVLAGDADVVRRFEMRSQTRRHASPPSVAAIAAGARALDINRSRGAQLRHALAQRIAQWRAGLAEREIAVRGGAFPVQMVPLAAGADPLALQQALARDGVTAVPQQSGRARALSFLLRADHGPRDIDGALAALAHHIRRQYEPVI